MSETPATPQQPEAKPDQQAAPTEKPRKKRRWLRCLLVLLVLIVVLVAVAPMIISTSFVTNLVVGSYSDSIRGKVELDNLEIGWFSPARIEGLRIYDPAGREVVSLESATTEKGLLGLAMKWYEFGEIAVRGPAVDLYLNEKGKASIEGAFEPIKPKVRKPKKKRREKEPTTLADTPPRGTLRIESARVTAHRPDGATLTIGETGLVVTLDGLGKINVEFGFRPGDQPRVEGAVSLDGPVEDGMPVVGKSTITANIASKGTIQLASFAEFLQVQDLAGGVDIDIQAKTDDGKVHVDHKLRVSDLVAPGLDAKTVRPITVSLDGKADMEHATGLLDLKTAVSSEAGKTELTFTGKPDELIKALAEADFSTLSTEGVLPELPGFRVTVDGKTDLPRLAEAVPALLGLQKDVKLTSGELAIDDIAVTGGATPSMTGAIRLAKLAGTRDGKPVRVAPISAALDAAQPTGGLLTLKTLRVQMGQQSAAAPLPLDLNANGTMNAATLTYNVNLGQLMTELGQIFDIGDTKLGGTSDGTLKLTRLEGDENNDEDDKLRLTFDAKLEGIQITPAAAPDAKEKPKPVQIDTILGWTGTLSAKQPLTQTGDLTIQDLLVVSDDKRFEQAKVQIPYELAFDDKADTLTIKAFQLTSTPALLAVPTMTGTITDVSGDKLLNLTGQYAADLDRLSELAEQLSPGIREQFVIGTRSEAPFQVTGPLADPSPQTMEGEGALAWQKGTAFGLAIGEAKFEPKLADGTLTVPEESFSAAGGIATLRATILSKIEQVREILPAAGDAPLLHIPGKLQVLKDAQLNADFSKQVLSRVNPLFSQLLKIEGLVSLDVEDIALPLDGDAILKTGAGRGRLDLSGVKITPTGALGSLAEFAGLSKDKPLPLTITGANFELTDGAVTYDKMDILFGETFDMRFRGRVGFDNSVDMVVSIPVRAGLLKKLGVGGSALTYAKAFEGLRVEIPITGTRSSPNLDLSAVDVGSLLKQAGPKLLEAGGKDLLPGLLDQVGGKKTDGDGGETKPAETILKGVLDVLGEPKTDDADKTPTDDETDDAPSGDSKDTKESDPAGALLRGVLKAVEESQKDKDSK